MHRSQVLRAYTEASHEVRLELGRTTIIEVESEFDVERHLGLFIYDEQGNLIQANLDLSEHRRVRFSAPRTGSFTIRLVNRSTGDIWYRVQSP